MRRHPIWTWVLCLLMAAPLPLAAQEFNGRGQQATSLFPLPEGLSVFELEHRAESGDFVVRLLDDQGQVIDELAHATGRFGGSKAIRIPRSGQYVLDVTAAGAWIIRRRPADGTSADPTSPAFLRGQEAGIAAGSSAPAGSWFARGVAGGLIGGPIGMGIASGMAARSRVDVPQPPTSGALDLAFDDGYRHGFEQRVRARRKKQTFVGGMVGTGILAGLIVAALDIAGSGEASGTNPPPPPGSQVSRVPS